jgi:hypothetical protein
MKNHKFTFTIPASSQGEADQKAAALAKLAGQFDGRTLAALARKGKSFLSHPVYGGMIKKELGL